MRWSAGLPIPGLASWLSDPSTGKSTVVQGLDETPAADRPTDHEVNVVHLAWDVMVGLGTLLFLLTLWWWASWIFRRDMPKSRWFLRISACTGVLAVVCLEAGWTVSEVGRQPWIVYEKMKVEDAATANTGIWITFIGVVILYIGLGVTTILVLRMMSRRFREGSQVDEADVPYGPSELVAAVVRAPRTNGRCSADGHHRCRHPLRGDHHLRDLRRRRLRRRLLGSRGGRHQARRATPRGHRPLDRSRLGGQPRVADLHLRAAVDLFPGGLRLDHPDHVRPVDAGRALGIVLRGASFAFRKAVFRTRDRRNFGAAFAVSSILVPYCLGAVVGGIASGRVPSGGKAGDPWDSWVNPTSVLGGVLAVCLTAYLAAFFLVRDAGRLSDETMVAYFRRRATAAAVAAGVVAAAGIFVLSNDAEYLFDGLTSRALPLVILSAVCGLAAFWLLARRARRGARLAAVGAVASLMVAWGVAQWDYLLPESLTVSDAAAPSGTITAVLVATGLAAVLIVPAFVLLYVLDQKTLLPEESMPEPTP